MLKNIIFVVIAVVAVAFAGFLFSTMTSNPLKTGSSDNSAAGKKDPVAAVKAYAARQFNVSEGSVTIISSTKHDWDDICMGMDIKDYDCTKTKTSGYEVTLEIDESRMRYRTNDDGSIIRFVKK